MNQKGRDHFYKYFNFEGIYKTLCANSIRLTAPSLFNDPFDINFPLNPPLSVEELTSYVVSSIATAISEGHHPKLARQALDKDK